MFLAFAWLGTFLIPLTIGYLGNQVAPNSPYLVWIWANLDGRHLIDIATKGYENFNFAYFPLYPSLISLLGYLIKIPHVYLGIFISLASLFGGMIYIHKIVLLDFNEKTAKLSVLLLSIFPLAFFYQAVYTDSLFLFLSTASFYYARKKSWLLSGVFGFLTCLTRLAGIALVVGLFIEWIIQNKPSIKKWKSQVIPLTGLLLASLGFFSYLAYLEVSHGSFLLFQKSFSAWQQSSIVFPPQVIFRYLKIFLSVNPKEFIYWIAALEFVCTFAYFALSYYVARKIRLSYGVFMFLLYLLVTFTGTFAGMPRYALHTFPIFIALAVLTKNNKPLFYALCSLFFFLGAIFTTLFTRGYFLT